MLRRLVLSNARRTFVRMPVLRLNVPQLRRFSTIAVAEVKKLRERTGAPLSECREALLAVSKETTDPASALDKAVEILRKKGVSVAGKKAGRQALQGLVAVRVDADGKTGAIVEVNSETDFVSRNPQFQTLVANIAQAAHQAAAGKSGPMEISTLLEAPYPEGKTKVGEALTNFVASIRENVQIRRAATFSIDGPSGILSGYAHPGGVATASADGQPVKLGRIATMIGLNAKSSERTRLAPLGVKFAMHLASAAPQYTTRNDVPADVLAKETEILREAAQKSDKPPKNEQMLQKVIEGKLNKYYQEVALMDQTFSVPDELFPKPVSFTQALKTVGENFKDQVDLAGWMRFQVGEGIQAQKKESFADEVAAKMAGR